jgi:diacylglycerol O-acyltransferase / wax synthase
MQRMNALDTTFLDVEDSVSHMHIGAIGLFEGPPPSQAQASAWVLGKLPLVPRYRQTIRRPPLSLGRPVWADDQCFNLNYHLRRTALPAPGGEQELRRLVGRIMSQQLDRGKPLWEMWLVEGLDEGRWALILKIHHALVDGVAGSDLLSILLDPDPDSQAPPVKPWRPRPATGAAELLAGALASNVMIPVRLTRATLAAPRRALARAVEATQGLLGYGQTFAPSASTLNGPLGPHRRWTWARASLAEIKQVRAVQGGTVNDVVLTCIAGGFRELLLARGKSLERPVRTLVPVSVRSEDQHGELNNRVTAMFADLPVDIDDPVLRLHAVSRQLAELKHSHEREAGEVLVSLADIATPPLLLALGERLATRVPQRGVNTVTTNVPGPRVPLYACGRRMVEAFPYVPLGGHVTIGVAIFSYAGACTFGVTGDLDLAPDIDVLAAGIEKTLAGLLARSRPKRAGAARGRGARASALGAASAPPQAAVRRRG